MEIDERLMKCILKEEYPTTGVKITEDYCFNNSKEYKLLADIYEGTGTYKELRPAVIFIHGGGWVSGSKKRFSRQAYYLAYKYGFFSVSINYRLCGETTTFPMPVEDVFCAIRWLRSIADQYGIDTEKIMIAGGSAGGHLAAMAAVAESHLTVTQEELYCEYPQHVNIAVVLNGIFDLKEMFKKNFLLSNMKQFLGCEFQNNEELYFAASPINYIHSGMPPILLLHGDNDTVVPIEQSIDFYNQVNKSCVPCELEVYKGESHGWFNREENFWKVVTRIEEFVVQYFSLG